MESVLNKLMAAAAQGQLGSAIMQYAPNINEQLASDARKAFLRANDARDGNTAMAAASVAAAAYERLGNHNEQLRNAVDALQMEFMKASTIEEYKSVREHGQRLAEQAGKLGGLEFEFRARVVAADAAYFAADAGENDVPWLILTLQDLLALCDKARPFQRTNFFIKFVDLLAASATIGMSRRFLPKDQKTINDLLRGLAKKVDDVIPPDVEFPGNPQQTAKIAERLMRLTDRYAS